MKKSEIFVLESNSVKFLIGDHGILLRLEGSHFEEKFPKTKLLKNAIEFPTLSLHFKQACGTFRYRKFETAISEHT